MLGVGVAAPAFAGPGADRPMGGFVHPSCTRSATRAGARPTSSTSRSPRASRRSGKDRITTQKDGLIRFAGTYRVVRTYSANEKTLLAETHGNYRDTAVVDNGDGTLTIDFKDATATKIWLDGAFLFHDTGLVEGAVLVDDNGTPTDPDDDENLGPVGEIALHGRFDTGDRDFCEDIAIFLGD